MTDAGEKLEQRYTKWLNESFDATNPYTIFDLVGFVRAELERAIRNVKQEARSWANPETETALLNVEAAIRKLKE